MNIIKFLRQHIRKETILVPEHEVSGWNCFSIRIFPKRRNTLSETLTSLFDIRMLPPTIGKRRKLQLVDAKLLTLFDKICRKHAVPWYLCGGTLLGAVRHHGFIPWDDDIDVSVPDIYRERIQKILEDELKGTNLYIWGVEKTRFNDATLRISHKNLPELNLDVFYSYCFTTKKEDRARVYAAWKSAHENYMQKYLLLIKDENRDSITRFRAETDSFYKSLIPESVHFDNPAATYLTTEIHWRDFRYIPMKAVLPFSTVDFEGLKCPAPHDPITYLEEHYHNMFSFPNSFDHHGDIFTKFDEDALSVAERDIDALIEKFS